MRVLLDTNVVIAALLWHGTPRRLLDRAIDDEAIELYSSPGPATTICSRSGRSGI